MRRRDIIPLLGGAVAWPLAARAQAQTSKLYRVGFLSPGGFALGTNPGNLTDEITRQLARSGFTPGVNLELVKRGADGHFERLPGLVAELVAAQVDVIVTFSYPAGGDCERSAREQLPP